MNNIRVGCFVKGGGKRRQTPKPQMRDYEKILSTNPEVMVPDRCKNVSSLRSEGLVTSISADGLVTYTTRSGRTEQAWVNECEVVDTPKWALVRGAK